MRTATRLLVAALMAMGVRLALQPLLPAEANPLLPPSRLIPPGWLPAAFLGYGTVVYALLGAVFVWLDPPGRGVARGVRFATLFAALWVGYLVEPLPHAAGASLGTLVGYPLADATGLLALGASLGWWFPGPGRGAWGRPGWSALGAGVVFATVRVIGSATLPLYTWLADRPVLTVGWALAVGTWLGLFYLRVRPLLPRPAPAWFASAVVGVDLLLFNGFMLLVADVSPRDLMLRTALDVVAMGLAAWSVSPRR